jgi:predicted ATPase
MSRLYQYHLENFKAFANEQVIPIRPITLIYGANSSGKSSIIQSLLLLKQSLDNSSSSDAVLSPQGDLVNLGNYREFIHRHEIERIFVFQAKFNTEFSEIPEIIQQLLNLEFDSSTSTGIEIKFFYSQESSEIKVDSVNLFLGDEKSYFISYNFDDEKQYFSINKLNSESLFWHSWWSKSKQELKKSFDNLEKNKLKDLGIHRPRLSKSQRKYFLEQELNNLQEEYQNLNNDEQEITKEQLEDKINRLESLLELQELFSAYSLDKSLQNYQQVINNSKCIESYRLKFLTNNFKDKDIGNDIKTNYLYEIFKDIKFYNLLSECNDFISKILLDFLDKIVYIGPLREFPERISIASDNSKKNVGKSGQITSNLLFRDNSLLDLVNKRFTKFGINYQLNCHSYHSNIDDQMESDIYSIRLVDSNNINVSLLDVGFGISQVLPVIAQCLLSQNETILIEQPELHLHPKLQTELGDLFVESALGIGKNNLIIETHSEHLMLRIMRRIRETSSGQLSLNLTPIKPEDVLVIFVESNGEKSFIQEIELNSRGEFVKSWPGGFFEEELNEIW